MSTYVTLKESFTTSQFKDVYSKDEYPFHNRWRNDPLSDYSLIRSNVAGYYPYNKTMIEGPTTLKEEIPKVIYPNILLLPDDYPITTPCSTIFPKSAYLAKSKTVNTPP